MRRLPSRVGVARLSLGTTRLIAKQARLIRFQERLVELRFLQISCTHSVVQQQWSP
jgi:hypothetical protein